MDLAYLFQKEQERQQKLKWREQIFAEERGGGFFERLDAGRQADVVDCLMEIRYGKRHEEREAARRALRAIYNETMDKRRRDARQWYMKQKDSGKYDEARNFLEDVEKRKEIYNPDV